MIKRYAVTFCYNKYIASINAKAISVFSASVLCLFRFFQVVKIGLLGLRIQIRRERLKPNEQVGYHFPEPFKPYFFFQFSLTPKRGGRFVWIFVFYFRRFRMSAAAAAMMITTARPIAMYVVVGVALVGG